MKKNRILALLLSFAILFTMHPGVEGYTIDKQSEIEGATTDINLLAANQNWQPKPTRTVSSADSFPLILNNGDALQIDGPIKYEASTGKSPITLAAGADVKIIINGSVTLHGADAVGTSGATAAINVPQGAKLTIYSAHDEELSTSKEAPKDTLTVSGGNAAAGANGENALKDLQSGVNSTFTTKWYTGAGGGGGGGAAAAIGGNGGRGGEGAAQQKSPVEVLTTLYGTKVSGQDDNDGGDGYSGNAGNQGSGAGTIVISGRLNINATGGSAAKGGAGGAGCGGYANTSGDDDMVGGCGGGGGGGGGLSALAFGAGGAGGSGGGSGGLLSSDHHGNVQGCGGGGGGGGWPNGGGGGGGGAECSDAENKNDNSSKGGAGGAGGAAGETGRSGSTGTQTGTSGHGLNDALPGDGGKGGPGVGRSSATSSGGNGGREKGGSYNGGDGGSGGTSVSLKSWHNDGCLILSTSANINTYSWGDGGGQGTVTALTPYVIYDLMDCQVNLTPNQYTYTGRQCRPTVQSVTYNAASDRDGKQIAGSDYTLSSSEYSISSYGENIHCPSGTVNILGRQDSMRTTVQTNGAVIGSTNTTFTIKKAKLTAPVNLSISNPYMNQSVTATLNTYTSETAGSGKLASLLRESSKKVEGPQVTWSFKTSDAGQFTETNDLQAEFMLIREMTTEVRATLFNMNDFEDCTVSASVTARTSRQWTPTLSADTPHPRIVISVNLPADISTATYQWYANNTKIDGATAQSYTPTTDDIGKTLMAVVTPSANTGYTESRVSSNHVVEDHKYSSNGFCTVCDEYQPAALSDGVYQIENGGQMFWFAALVNGEGKHAVFHEKDQDASGLLTKSIDLENREWTPIGTYGNAFGGDFDGQKNTISKLSITKTNSYAGLFGYTTGNISNFTVENGIVLSGSGGSRIGGAIGTAYGGKVFGICSKAHIINSNNAYSHIGGVVGGVDNPETAIEQCLFTGSIQIYDSTDCIGGIVGYSNGGACIRNCANLGSVTATAQDAYTGGILGYVNNVTPSIQNCYSYGTVQNGGGNYCGAIVGRVRNHTAAKYTDNYYLNTSAPAAFGAGSNSTTAKAYAKDAASFASGEVCYLVNSKTSTGNKVIWKQDIDNGNTPYDTYPVYDAAVVYFRSDGTYSNNPERISVTISWGAMEFDYHAGHWDPDTHEYSGGWSPVNDGGDELSVQNNSNVELNVEFIFTADQVPSSYNLTGSFSGVAAGANRMNHGATIAAKLALRSLVPEIIKNIGKEKLGDITVRITTIGGGN